MTEFESLPADVGFDDLTGPADRRVRLEAIRDAARDGRPVGSLFSGPSGTGKTFAARALANELDKPIFRIDLSNLVTKDIGETEKNLRRILDDAKAAGAILLFDEADAVFAERSDVAEVVLDMVSAYPGHVIFEMRHEKGVPKGIAAAFAHVIEFFAPHVHIEQLESAIRAIPAAHTAVTGFVGAAAQGPIDQATSVATLGDYIDTFGGLDVAYPMSHAVAHFFENGGSHAKVVRVVSRSGGPCDPIIDDDLAGPSLESGGHGIWAMRGAGVDLVVVPPLGPGTDVSAGTRRAVVALAAGERGVAILDPPATWIAASDVAVADLGLVEHYENAAVYWPRIEAADGAGGTAMFAPAGAVAGVFARIDHSRGVWKAPAGTDAALAVTGLSATVTDADIEHLNGFGVNTLKTASAGHLVWGARTLAAPQGSDWRYVPVRRTALFLERSLSAGLEWVVFEPNDEPLWAQLRLTVDAFMAELWGDGAFRGDKADEAYFVRCDRSTTTQADVDRHIVNVVVGFAPLKPAEFVVIEVALPTA